MSDENQTFDVFCPDCNIQVAARVICAGSGGFSSNAVSPFQEADAEYYGDNYSVSLCPRCQSPFFIKQSRYGVPGEFETTTNEVVLYPKTSRLPASGIPDAVQRAYEQAHKCFSSSSYEACALMCRRSLEALCKSLAAPGRNLQAKLDALSDAGTIDKRLTEWAHGVRAIGNEAAHDVESELTKNDARDALDFTEALLVYVFALNARFNAFQERRIQNRTSQNV